MPKRLSQRLTAVASLVPQGAYLADVGSDHAWLPIFLVESGKIDYAMAIDNKTGPFLRMKENIESSKAKNRITPLNSDGITRLNEGVDTLALCGMGGLLACSILEAHPENLANIQTIIIDPHRDLMAVRKRVSELGFRIDEEVMVKEDRVFYTIIRFVRGFPKAPYTPNELAFGPILMRRADPIYVEWLETQKKKIGELLNNKAVDPAPREHDLGMYRAVSAQLMAVPKAPKDN